MFRSLKKNNKISIGKKVKFFFFSFSFSFFFFSSYLNFVFALYTLISPNVQIILEKKFTYPSRSQRIEPILKISKKLVVNSFHETLVKTQKAPYVI